MVDDWTRPTGLSGRPAASADVSHHNEARRLVRYAEDVA